MASATRQPQPSSLSPLARSAPAVNATSQADVRPHASAGLTSLADAGLKASPLKPNTALRAFQAPALTGAAAMADEERANEKRAQGTSPNQTFNAANIFSRDRDMPMSKPGDAAGQGSPAAASAAAERAPSSSAITAEPMQIDVRRQSPTSLSGSDSAHSKHPNSSTSRRLSATADDSQVEERSHKAFTYPPRPDQIVDRAEPSRQMSLPNANSTRSPSNRKHRCPHCSTEFTRHHNLKSHLLTHSQEKPFACENCNQKFRRLHDLKRHTKLHTGERPHVCEKCNRKFARGDALARHSKGPGGCAGRRGSMGDDDEEGQSTSLLDPSMDGVVYDHNDEAQQGDPKRRKSAPDHGRKRSLQVANATPQTSRQTSTYPPVAPMARPDYKSDSNFHQPTHLSPRMASASSQSVPHFASSAFGQGSMTESPGPLSPRTAESRRLSAGLPPPRARSPSLATSFAQQHITRGSVHSSPPLALPSSQMMGHPPHLPSISGLGSDSRNRTSYPSPPSNSYAPKPGRPPPIISTHPPPPGANGPNSASSTQPGSASSHHRSSGGSMREVLNNPTSSNTNSGDDFFRDYVRKAEADKQSLRDEFSAKQAEYETIIAELRAELAGLRGQRPSVLPPPPAQ